VILAVQFSYGTTTFYTLQVTYTSDPRS